MAASSFFWQRRPSQQETTIPCRQCGAALHAVKTWRQVVLRCVQCNTTFPLKEYARQMDAALEQFLENNYCDRVWVKKPMMHLRNEKMPS